MVFFNVPTHPALVPSVNAASKPSRKGHIPRIRCMPATAAATLNRRNQAFRGSHLWCFRNSPFILASHFGLYTRLPICL